MIGTDAEKFERERDARLRRAILKTLEAAQPSPMGGLHGEPLMLAADARAARGMAFEGDEQFVRLLQDCERFGLVELKTFPRKRWERFGPRHVFAKLTAKGQQLLMEAIPAVPGVWDERAPDGE